MTVNNTINENNNENNDYFIIFCTVDPVIFKTVKTFLLLDLNHKVMSVQDDAAGKGENTNVLEMSLHHPVKTVTEKKVLIAWQIDHLVYVVPVVLEVLIRVPLVMD